MLGVCDAYIYKGTRLMAHLAAVLAWLVLLLGFLLWLVGYDPRE